MSFHDDSEYSLEDIKMFSVKRPIPPKSKERVLTDVKIDPIIARNIFIMLNINVTFCNSDIFLTWKANQIFM
jgi:hypothetical protein